MVEGNSGGMNEYFEVIGQLSNFSYFPQWFVNKVIYKDYKYGRSIIIKVGFEKLINLYRDPTYALQ